MRLSLAAARKYALINGIIIRTPCFSKNMTTKAMGQQTLGLQDTGV